MEVHYNSIRGVIHNEEICKSNGRWWYYFRNSIRFNVTEHNGVSNEAQAQTHTSQGYYYHYHGYTKSGGEFVLNHTFYNALKAGNVTFNGIKVNEQYQNGTSTKSI